MVENSEAPVLAKLDAVGAADWEWLAGQTIFFGHQSVGRNIMSGIRLLLEDHPDVGLTLINNDSLSNIVGPAFVEANVGRNGDPASKREGFERAISALGEGQRIAMFKYCYVDVTPATDVRELFREYEANMDEIRAANPDLVIVHFTLPLRTSTSSWKDHIKRLIGRPAPVALNALRNEYNGMLIERYGGREPIFDLARLESTRADGTRSAVRYFGDTVYTLAPEWTDDGGHLNEAAQRRVAEQLLVFLVGLRPRVEGAVAAETR